MSSVFDNYKFMEGASEQEFFNAAVENAKKLMQLEAEGLQRDVIHIMLGWAIEIGTLDDGEISEQEDRMIKYVLENTYPESSEKIMDQVNSSMSVDFTLIRLSQLNQMGGPTIMVPLLNLILCFAYVDGVFDETTAERLAKSANVASSPFD